MRLSPHIEVHEVTRELSSSLSRSGGVCMRIVTKQVSELLFGISSFQMVEAQVYIRLCVN